MFLFFFPYGAGSTAVQGKTKGAALILWMGGGEGVRHHRSKGDKSSFYEMGTEKKPMWAFTLMYISL